VLIRIDPSADSPLFEQVGASVRAEIAAGRLSPGERLPAARDVAASLGMNAHTVLHAYQALRDEGLLELRRGRGAVVTAAAARLVTLRAELADVVRRAAADGIGVDTLAALVRSLSDDPTSPAPTERTSS
jgi:GntR family transcriptional regulator